jgi:hypothetical protein
LQVEYDDADHLREALALIIPGETLYAVLAEHAQGPAYLAVTDRRLIFLDQGQIGPEQLVVSLPFSRLTALAFAADAGMAFATARLIVQAGGHQWTFDFGHPDQAHRAYHLIIGNLLQQEWKGVLR